MLMWSSRNKAGNILRLAASSGSRDAFGAVLACLELELPPAEVLYCCSYQRVPLRPRWCFVCSVVLCVGVV